MKTVIVTAGVIIEKKKVLVAQRKEGSLRSLLWEFPGGKAREGEDPRDALRRELKEELDIDAEPEGILEAVFHSYPEHSILLLAYRCRIRKGVPKPVGCRDLRWVDFEELNRLAMSPADEPVRSRIGPSGDGFL